MGNRVTLVTVLHWLPCYIGNRVTLVAVLHWPGNIVATVTA